MNKQIGIIGLGKMGGNMALLLKEKGWKVVGYNRNKIRYPEMQDYGIQTVDTLQELIKSLEVPRLIWIMVSHNAISEIFTELSQYIDEGDVVIDGGNTNYLDTKERSRYADRIRIDFLDAGVSGGPKGAREGASIMIGGNHAVFLRNEELFKDLSIQDGYQYVGESGAGHFVKMIHNAIEYGMMQSIAEGFNVLKHSDYKFDLVSISKLFGNSSVIDGKLIQHLEEGYKKYGVEIAEAKGSVDYGGEALWTIETAEQLGLDVDVIKKSFEFRVNSKENPSYVGKILTMLRNMFGGHNIK